MKNEYIKSILPVLCGYIGEAMEREHGIFMPPKSSWTVEQLDVVIGKLATDTKIVNNIFCMCSWVVPNPDAVKTVMINTSTPQECLNYIRRI
ncbi:MAG: hypothetical protein ACRCX2_15670 [Paraclostridium sp.]